MSKENIVDASVSLTMDSRNRYAVQDMKNYKRNLADISLMNKPENNKTQEDWHTLDFIKVKFQ